MAQISLNGLGSWFLHVVCFNEQGVFTTLTSAVEWIEELKLTLSLLMSDNDTLAFSIIKIVKSNF